MSDTLGSLLQSADEIYPTTVSEQNLYSRAGVRAPDGRQLRVVHPLACLIPGVSQEQVKLAMDIIAEYPIPDENFDRPPLQVLGLLAYLCKNPTATLTNIALYFGVSVGTVRSIVSSDLFQASIAEMQLHISTELLVDVQHEILAGVKTATEQINRKMVKDENPEYALRAVRTLGKLAGMGAPTVALSANSPAINITNHIQMAKEAYDNRRNQPTTVELRAELCAESGEQVSDKSSD